MKTYNFFYILLACLVIIGCDKSDNGSGSDGGDNKSIDADYTVLLKSGGMLTSKLLNANAEVITLNPANSPFAAMAEPQLTYKDGAVLGLYKTNADCSGAFTKHDFDDNSSKTLEMPNGSEDCNHTVSSIAHHGNVLYLSYVAVTNSVDHFVRTVNLNSADFEFVDVELDRKPEHMAFANNRLFILLFDDKNGTDEYALMVMDASTNELISEIALGFDVKRIFKNGKGEIVVSYDELHTTVNSTTFATKNIRYLEGTELRFADSEFNHFDIEEKMYYITEPSAANSAYPIIPIIYDFSENVATLYSYENFLNEQQRNFEFEIETTTMVGFDEKNGLLLVGYRKSSNSGKGGLLRIKLAPVPAVVDNLDLDGVPYDIYAK